MANTIGKFTITSTGYTGRVKTLQHNFALDLVKINESVANGPKYQAMAGDVHIGAAWEKEGRESGLVYLQVTLDDPAFDKPLYANLYQSDEGGHDLVWQRK